MVRVSSAAARWRLSGSSGRGWERRWNPGKAKPGTTPTERLGGAESPAAAPGRIGRARGSSGFTLLEVMLVILILGLLSAIAVPNLLRVLADVRVKRAMADLRTLESEIALYTADYGHLPDALGDLDQGRMLDPWGNPYQYLRIAGVANPQRGKWRKDQYLVPLNSDYDLYSMGPDGQSKPPLTAAASQDDIVRAGNGSFVGVATDY